MAQQHDALALPHVVELALLEKCGWLGKRWAVAVAVAVAGVVFCS